MTNTLKKRVVKIYFKINNIFFFFIYILKSYGNLTSLNFKYKIFVRKEEVSLANPVKSNSLYSSSALYSQTSSRSSLNKHVYIYYLNALIESENDEGVYLCMNPDLPNLILRNVTVLLSSTLVIHI